MTDIIDDLKQRLAAIGFADAKIDKVMLEVRHDWHGERPYISIKCEYQYKQSERNRAIIRAYKSGESVSLLARRYGLSRQRISKIING